MESTLELLQRYESRNVTFIDAAGGWPIVWKKARGTQVWDEQGRKYLDLTAAFGVAATGHANPRVVSAGQRQMKELLHAMGDVHPHTRKAELLQELSRLTFERWDAGEGKSILGNSGFEAVEAALKTAYLFTGKGRVIAFDGSYHGLGYGALNATSREHFRGPFRSQLREFASFVPFPTTGAELAAAESAIREIIGREPIGAILVEPIQARGGIRIPHPQFLEAMRKICDANDILLILDEIYTGFGRTGAWFACELPGVVPDLICLGKALTGGFPLSACVGKAAIMDKAWPPSNGEAIHTSTYLGHPVGCAMALAQIDELESKKLIDESARKGIFLASELRGTLPSRSEFSITPRGVGLMAGVEIVLADGTPATELSLGIIKNLLQKGFILLPEGEHANVISFTPPLTISKTDLRLAVRALAEELASA